MNSQSDNTHQPPDEVEKFNQKDLNFVNFILQNAGVSTNRSLDDAKSILRYFQSQLAAARYAELADLNYWIAKNDISKDCTPKLFVHISERFSQLLPQADTNQSQADKKESL